MSINNLFDIINIVQLIELEQLASWSSVESALLSDGVVVQLDCVEIKYMKGR